MLQAAFIFIAPGADPKKDRGTVETPSVALTSIGVSTYEQAVEVTKELVAQGIGAVELCGGFGIRGTYLVEQAASGKAKVGVVRFDAHPGLGFKSGDDLF